MNASPHIVGKAKSETVRITSTGPGTEKMHETGAMGRTLRMHRNPDPQRQGLGDLQKVNRVPQVCWCSAGRDLANLGKTPIEETCPGTNGLVSSY